MTAVPEPETDPSWRNAAACLHEDPELFFPEGRTGPHLLQIKEAKAVCHTCPVRIRCGTWALDNPNSARTGIWGGLSEDDRAAILRKRAKARRAAAAATAAA